jgi:(p)ppGpp synthase/HD superfamily hydrolase
MNEDGRLIDDLIRRADGVAFAAREMGRKTYGTWPDKKPRSYLHHLALVEGILLWAGLSFDVEEDRPILLASWNHDTIEDSGATYNDLRFVVGPDVADLCYDVTDGKGKTRAERFAPVIPTLLANPKARVLKLADRIANTFMSRNERSGMYGKYVKEYPEFRELFYGKGTASVGRLATIEQRLWWMLDRLSCEEAAADQ